MSETYLTAQVTAEKEMQDDQNKKEKTKSSGQNDRPSHVPEKFWDAEKKELRADVLLNSYLALEKKLSSMIPVPENDEDRMRFLKYLGVPDTPDGYQITLSNDFLDVDPELNMRLHGKGFTPDQVQEVYDLAAEKLVPLILEMAAEFQAEREIERLVESFGGVSQWQEISRQLHEFGQKVLPQQAFEGMACSYDGVMALYKMMQKDGKIPSVRAASSDLSVLDEAALRKMMQDPRYWRDRNPSFIAKVSEGFEKLYGGDR
ncbi:MAG: hypothetical protein KDJ26_01220 [Alphaproteobacteria bacterium]|jgi:hypothetical protein|nr:hypothetical protein [Alphaproteobacteria bacterium]MCB1550599.1 hypothetical protein [Alphaproteobacteria bacterium]MCB9985464.1 hypothetical protein [Micavibrio sp.]HPQ50350.1 hypothetical protein [Alphaproteobacteria bacterium]HRK98523.1 hypothetical protein [Alphaproteobacteria bacterium]